MDIVVTLLLVAVALPVAGAVYERLSAMRAQRHFATPPGEWVEVVDTRLHFKRMGPDTPLANTPTIILEANIGGSWLDWSQVQPEVAQFAPVVAYDRAGYGWSDTGKNPPTRQQIAQNLHEMLQQAGIEPPYILVGHSMAGLHVRTFMQQYPQEVAGLILVDSVHPALLKARDNHAELNRVQRIKTFRAIGLLRLLLGRALSSRLDYLTPQVKTLYIATTVKDVENIAREGEALFFNDDLDLPDDIGDRPLIVVSRNPLLETETGRRRHEHQQDLMTLSSECVHIVTEQGNHYVHLAEADIVVEAIQYMVEAVRTGQSLYDVVPDDDSHDDGDEIVADESPNQAHDDIDDDATTSDETLQDDHDTKQAGVDDGR